MYLSAERLALANEVVKKTFADTSIAWQTVPHWDTGDPGQINVPSDTIPLSAPLVIVRRTKPFKVTLAQAIAPTPDGLLSSVIHYTTALAEDYDQAVFFAIQAAAAPAPTVFPNTPVTAQLKNALIEARKSVENAGYHSPSCMLINTEGLKGLTDLVAGASVVEILLTAANINSVNRIRSLAAGPNNGKAIVLGRRKRITHGGAADALPGDEPVDVAISLSPSLEVVGDDINGKIDLTVRIRFAVRVKDAGGVVGVAY